MLLFNTLGIFFTFGKGIIRTIAIYGVCLYIFILFFLGHCFSDNISMSIGLPINGGFTLISEFLLAGSENENEDEKCKNWFHGLSIIGSVDQKYINNPK